MTPCLNKHLLLMLVSLWILTIIIHGTATRHGDIPDRKFLNVGEELLKETLPLQAGLRVYQLQGFKSFTWYEVKISYPASIPASFSIQLKKANSDLGLKLNRRLLNTEKLIFKTDSLDNHSNEGGLFVSVIVEPEGVVAIGKFVTSYSCSFHMKLGGSFSVACYVWEWQSSFLATFHPTFFVRVLLSNPKIAILS